MKWKSILCFSLACEIQNWISAACTPPLPKSDKKTAVLPGPELEAEPLPLWWGACGGPPTTTAGTPLPPILLQSLQTRGSPCSLECLLRISHFPRANWTRASLRSEHPSLCPVVRAKNSSSTRDDCLSLVTQGSVGRSDGHQPWVLGH